MKKLLLTSLVIFGVMTAVMAQETKPARPSAGKKPVEETMSQKRARIVMANKTTRQKTKQTVSGNDAFKKETIAADKVKTTAN